MKKLGLTILMLPLIIYAQSIGHQWSYNAGSDYDAKGKAITTDAQGNIYTTGTFGGTTDFNLGVGVNNLTFHGGYDVFIAKYDSVGNYIWAVNVGNTGFNDGNGITTDNSGNVYVTGYFSAITDFDPGAGVLNITPVGLQDIFILKLNSSGTLVWVKTVGSSGDDRGNSVAVDPSGNVYTTGYFGTASAAVDFDPGPGVYNMNSVNKNAFILKLDANGNFVWSANITDPSSGNYDEGHSIKTDASGNVYATGFYVGTCDFDFGPGVYNLTSIGTQNNAYILKLNGAGVLQWAKRIGNAYDVKGNSISLDNNNNVLVSGICVGSADFDPDAGVANLNITGVNSSNYVLKLDNTGNYIWAKNIFQGISIITNGIDTDVNGNIYTTGYFDYTGTFDLNGGSPINISTNGQLDIYHTKIDESGNFQWGYSYGSTSNDIGFGITADINDRVITTGYFTGNVDFNPTGGIRNLTSGFGTDLFIQKLYPCNANTGSTSITACNTYTSPSGNHTWTSSGIYLDTLGNMNGCDSILTINLTIVGPTSSNINISACHEYTLPSGNDTYDTTGVYTDIITNHWGCDSNLTINLTIIDADTSITIANGTYTVAQSGATYQWGDCNTQLAIPGETNQTFTPTSNGSYAVIINYNGCVDTTGCQSIFNVGIGDLHTSNFSLYPNPSTNYIHIYPINDMDKVIITDITGKIALTETNLYSLNGILDVSTFQNGVYFVEIYTGSGVSKTKFIKQ